MYEPKKYKHLDAFFLSDTGFLLSLPGRGTGRAGGNLLWPDSRWEDCDNDG